MARTLKIKTLRNNYLINVSGKVYFFIDVNGKFLRGAGKEEWNLLCSKVGHKNVIKDKVNEYNFYACHQEPELIDKDSSELVYSNYKFKFCGLNLKFQTLETSSSGSYDELNRKFVASIESIPVYAVLGLGIFEVGFVNIDEEIEGKYVFMN